METTAKSPVNIIQELIAMHTTRKEAYEKLKQKGVDPAFKSKLGERISQSEHFTSELLNELSEFGDAVSGEVDKDSAFNTIYNNALGELDNMKPEELVQTFEQMEDSLRQSYQQFIEATVEGTGALMEILRKQAQAI